MSPPAMPGPARLAGKSLLYLRKAGHDEAAARRILKEVIESLASQTDAWEPWALDWWRKLWLEANGTGATTRTHTIQAGKDHHA